MSLLDQCKVSNPDDDRFVGIKVGENGAEVTFPRGYRLSTDERDLRRDIVQLITLIKRMSDKREGEGHDVSDEGFELSYPFFSYQYIIQDYINHGFFVEKEKHFVRGTRGKSDWKRTIQQIQPSFSDDNIVYLEMIVRKNEVNENNLITNVHKYCVRKSIEKIGWLYSLNSFTSPPESIPFDRKVFRSVVLNKLKSTFDEKKKKLLYCMLQIIDSEKERTNEDKPFSYGVNRFEYVWQSLIDYVFGVDNRERFFPHAEWHILSGSGYLHETSPLEPDTVIQHKGNIYILDAKYYRYGLTRNANHLPPTDSIQKQLTYGEYVANKGFAGKGKIFNAFVMPFASKNDEHYEFVSIGRAQWIDYSKEQAEYNYIQGILLDTKYIIESYARQSAKEIESITNLMETSLSDYLENEKKLRRQQA